MVMTPQAREPAKDARHAQPGIKAYVRFALMIITSTALMYWLMYLNTYQWDHVVLGESRLYMTLIMGAVMAIVMLSFMLRMYPSRWANVGIYVGSVIVFVLALWLVRSQRTVQDVSYMKSMIPHHSVAILTSERAQISDPRVRELADEIIKAQRREIAEMKALIADIKANGKQNNTSGGATEMLLGPKVPPPDASAVKVPDGFRAEVVLSGLTYPTSVELDDQGTMYVAEAGYSYGDPSPTPRILRISKEGQVQVLVSGKALRGPINDLLWHEGRMYVSHRGMISVIEGGQVRNLVTELPSEGDHHNNQMTVGPDGKIYFGQGTATNSGVVGLDNYKMGWLSDHPQFHDTPAHDIQLVGRAFVTADALKPGEHRVQTSAFHAFGKAAPQGALVEGQTKASGTILRVNPDGSQLEVYAWGLRNPYGVMWSPEGKLYATENGFDVRGSRPIANDEEDIYVIRQGAWYGWPDYAMGLPVTDPRFKPENEPQPQFVMTEHPPVEQPWLNFPKHSAITKMDFAKSDTFGKGQMFVAFFGHMSPITGKAPDEHGGHRVLRVNPATREFTAFFTKKEQHHGEKGQPHGSAHSDNAGRSHGGGKGESMTAGPRRPMDVRFSPGGDALYIADFGTMVVEDEPRPVPGTGVIWRVVPKAAKPAGPPTGLSAPR